MEKTPVIDGRKRYRFGPFILDCEGRTLYRDGQEVEVSVRAFEILHLLVSNSGRIIDRDQMIETVWEGAIVEESNISHHISSLRQILNSEKGREEYIQTLPRRGYKFIAPVEVIEVDDQPGEVVTGKRGGEFSIRRIMVPALVLLAAVIGFFTAKAYYDRPEAGMDSSLRTLAVLPFKPTKRDGDLDLGLGIADSLITGLSVIEPLRVKPLGTVRAYGDFNRDPLAAAKDLGVEYVVDGTYRMYDDSSRLSVWIYSLSGGRALWTESFEIPSTDPKVIEEVAGRRVSRFIVHRVCSTGLRFKPVGFGRNEEVKSLFFKARYLQDQVTEESLLKAVELYRRAIELDQGFELAWAGLAESYNLLGIFSLIPPNEAFPKAKEAAEEALSLDGYLVSGHAALGLAISAWDRDWSGVRKRYIELLNIDSPETADWLSIIMMQHGQLNSSLQQAGQKQSAVIADVTGLWLKGAAHYYKAEFDQAIKQCSASVDLNPSFFPAHWCLAAAHHGKGDYPRAIEEYETASRLAGGSGRILGGLGHAYADSGNQEAARSLLQRLMRESGSRYVSPYGIFLIHLGLKDYGQARIWLERAIREKCPETRFLKNDPKLDPLRSRPEFADLLG
ncbi:MAG: winged helix-turn-helix domain-containing protein [Blastocatellales bacterium]